MNALQVFVDSPQGKGLGKHDVLHHCSIHFIFILVTLNNNYELERLNFPFI